MILQTIMGWFDKVNLMSIIPKYNNNYKNTNNK